MINSKLKIKKCLLCVISLNNGKAKSWFRSRLEFLYWKVICTAELFEKNLGVVNFVSLDIDLALIRYCLQSWDCSVYVLDWAVVFFEKSLLLTYFNGWYMFIKLGIYKITEDHSVAASHTRNRLELVKFDYLSFGGSFANLFLHFLTFSLHYQKPTKLV